MDEIHNQHIIAIGTVIAVHPSHSLVQVNLFGRETGFLPVLQLANSFKRQFTPMRIQEQVMVLADRYVIRAIYNQQCKEPAHDEHTDVVEYEDGTRITYSTKTQKLTVTAVGNITVTCQKASVQADQVAVDAQRITLNNGDGIVTGAHICAATGKPHAHCSKSVFAGA